MFRSSSQAKTNDNQRPQLVPSPSQGSPPSPLELENWYIPDFDWLKEPDTPNTLSFPDSQNMESSFCSQRFYIEDFLPKTDQHMNHHLQVPSQPLNHNHNNQLRRQQLPQTQQQGQNCVMPSPPYINPPPSNCHSKNQGYLVTEIKRETMDTYTQNGGGGGDNNCVFRPVDVKQEPSTNNLQVQNHHNHHHNNNNNCQLSMEKMEQLQSLAVEQASKDISAACGVLGIGSDPRSWSAEEVRSWIGWILRQYDLPPVAQMDRVRLDGPAFCALTEEQMRRFAPHCGDILYAQLEIWKNSGDLRNHHSPPHTVSFKGDDTFLDLSAILNHWHSSEPSLSGVIQHQQMSPNGHQPLSPQHPSQFYTALNVNVPSPGVSVVPEIQVNAAGSDFNSEGIPSEDEASDDSAEMDARVSTSGTPANGVLPLASGGAAGVLGATGRPGSHSHIHLWQFLKELLNQSHLYGSSIRWLDRSKGVFKIEDSVRVARLWGKRKNRPAMNYDKLSRSIRQYYKKGIMKKTERSQRLVYQFCHPYCL